MSSSKLCAIIEESPEYESVFDEHKIWKHFDAMSWTALLQFKPELSDRCDKYNGWKDFDGENWAELLADQPLFEAKCTQLNAWKKLDVYDWLHLGCYQSEILDRHNPNFEEQYEAEMGEA